MSTLLSQYKLFVKRNSSTILTCLGGVGVIATAVMAVKATPKALSLIEEAKEEKGEELSKWETVKVAGPVYVPAILTGVGTLACIFGSNIISKHQQATLMSAYALLDKSYKEYREKVDEIYGENAGEQVRAEIAKDAYTGDGTLEDDDKELFYDFYSGRHFESTRETVLQAAYETNRALFVNCAVGLNEYYDFLGLPPRPEYDEIGWTCGQMEEMYWHPWIEFQLEETVIDDDAIEGETGLECTIIHLPLEPVMGYLDY
jgi:hypothetical protein